jgi:hypothetical protein
MTAGYLLQDELVIELAGRSTCRMFHARSTFNDSLSSY